MRSRSARRWSRASAEVGALALALAAAAPRAGAGVFAQPANLNGGGINGGSRYAASSGYANGGIAYYAITSLTGGAFPDTGGGSGLIDVTKTQGAEGTALTNALQLNVLSDNATIAAPAGNTLVLTITTVSSTGGGSAKNVPIAGVNGTACGNGASCFNGFATPPVGGHSYAVSFFAGQPITIHVYPKDICGDYAAQSIGFTAMGCDAGSGTVVPGITTPPMQLTLNVTSVDGSGNIVSGNPLDTGTVNLNFQNTSPQFNCPSDMSNIYKPGDTQITLDGTGFSLPQNPGLAPLAWLYVVGTTKAPTPNLTQAGIRSNALFAQQTFGNQEHVSGFVNKTSGTDTTHDFNLAFVVKDSAGLIQPTPSSGAACTLGPVETSAIQGFLSQSKCFIATAAFRSVGAAPVAMLREFRDRILLATAAGRAFTRAYYRWSPEPAEWLMLHPQFRQPVLLALLPLEIAAWLLLHPAFLAAPLALLALALAAAARLSSSGPAAEGSSRRAPGEAER